MKSFFRKSIAAVLTLGVLLGTLGGNAAYANAVNHEESNLGASTSCARHTLGTFSGVPACVNANGDLHICAKNFPDEIFRNYVKNLKGVEEGYFTPKECSSVRSIDLPSSCGVRSLRGIEFFIYLNYLCCYCNQLTELDISRNTDLRTLYCYENQLTNLDVSNNTNLIFLYCHGNQLTELDVSGNTALKTLDCQLNQLTKLDVSGNTVLKDLYCCNNQLTDLDVSGDTVLKTLYCNNNQLTDLNVSSNTALTSLYCDDNHLTRLDVRDNINLHSLDCSNNNITELFINEQDDNWWWNLIVSPQTSTLPLVQNGAVWTADLRSLVEDTSRVETDTISEGIYDWDTGLIIFTKKPTFFECYIGKGRQEMLVIVYLTEPEATYKATINGTEYAYAAGEQVSLAADAFYLDGNWGYRFEAWTGDVDAVADVKSSTTTFTMPAQDLTITANHYLIGDVDGNGVVDAVDAAAIIRMANGTMTPTLAGDITGTGVVDAMSAANIARYIAGTFTPAK